MNGIDAYIEATQGALAQLDEMLGYERAKRQALLGNDEKTLDEMLQNQQACLMKLESVEKKRVRLQKEAGFGAMSADQILESMDPSERKDMLEGLFRRLRESASELKELNKKAADIARSYLYIVGSAANAGEPTYKPGRPKTDSPVNPTFEEKI